MKNVVCCAILLLLNVMVTLKAQTTDPGFDSTVHAFDIGPSGNPVWPGFTALTHDDIYGNGSTFGWLAPDVTIVGTRSLAGADPLGIDYATGFGPFEFKIDITNDNYTVILFAGDLMYGSVPYDIELGGQPHIVNGDSGPQFTPKIFTTSVTNGNLTLKVTSGTTTAGFGRINAIIIAPDTVAAETIQKCQNLAQQMYNIDFQITGTGSPIWQQRTFVETIPAPTPTQQQSQNGYIPFAAQPARRIFPNSNPTEEEITTLYDKGLCAMITPGQDKSLTIGIKALQNLSNLLVTASQLQGPGGSVLPAPQIRVVRQWPQKIIGSWDTVYAVVPEILDPCSIIGQITQNTTRQFWFTVQTDQTTAAGLYQGTVTLSLAGQEMDTFNIRIEVLPYALDDQEDYIFGLWYQSQYRQDQIVYDMPNIKNHGFETITLSAPTSFVYDYQYGWTYDYSAIEQAMQHYLEADSTAPFLSKSAPFENVLPQNRSTNPLAVQETIILSCKSFPICNAKQMQVVGLNSFTTRLTNLITILHW